MNRARAGAFTLLEVVVVLAVVALAAGIVVPRMSALEGITVDAAARRLADAIGFGRERAILGGTTLRLVVDLDGGQWQLGRPGGEPGTLAPARDGEMAPLGRATRLPVGVRVAAVGIGGAFPARSGAVVLELRPDGDALPVRIDLADRRGHAATITVPPARGRPLVRAGEGS